MTEQPDLGGDQARGAGLDRAEIERQLATELERIHRDGYGKGSARPHAHLTDDSVLVFLDDLELQPNEEFLIGTGYAETVISTRTHFQQAIEVTFRAAVERITGRTVVSFASVTKLDPNYAIEVFRLAPIE